MWQKTEPFHVQPRMKFYNFMFNTVEAYDEHPRTVKAILEPFKVHLNKFIVPLDYTWGIDMENSDHLSLILAQAELAIDNGLTMSEAYEAWNNSPEIWSEYLG